MRSFRSFLVVVVCLVSLRGLPASGAASDNLRSGRDSVEIRIAETVQFHPRAGRLNEVCRAGRDVHACTDFPEERFDCHCERDGDGWRLAVRGDLVAVVHLTDQRYLAHERLHLADIEAAIPAALAPFLDRVFTQEESCATLARVMSLPSFAVEIMNRIRAESNERLGCVKKGTTQFAGRR